MDIHGENGAPTRSRGLALGYTGLVLSAVLMLGVHIVGSGQIDAVGSTLSALVFVDGYGWMFGASVLCMAAGAAGVGVAARGHRPLRWTLGVVAVCCVLVAVFPTNESGPLTASAEIHRYAAGVAFFLVPVAALLVAVRLPHGDAARRGLLRGTLGAGVILLLFLTSHFGVMPEAVQDLRGVFQRSMFVLQLGVLARMLRATARPVTVAVPAARRPVLVAA
ncbi:DUF998 domain-containing protein [Actinokineospora guangxiensis]|uniref:DUF998 domain-containing protein n=1 Tax=Actinokineospora guangxiensis TaxID=1490288 RepID=A0ABW0EQF9_9PSEU